MQGSLSMTFCFVSESHGCPRKFDVPVDYSAYKDWRQQHRPSTAVVHASTTNGTSAAAAASLDDDAKNTASPSSHPPAPYPPTFSQIVDLITTGQPIPGIKDIPDTVLAGQETQPTTAKRKKPWESAGMQVQGGQEVQSLVGAPI